MVFPVFYEASGTSARNHHPESTASKPCRPRGVCLHDSVSGCLRCCHLGWPDVERRPESMPLIVDTSRVGPPERFRTWARILARDDEPLAARRDAELPFSVFMQRLAVGPAGPGAHPRRRARRRADLRDDPRRRS